MAGRVKGNDTYVAVLGDAIASRGLPPRTRAALQERVRASLATVNRRWRSAVAARFVIVLGDQFEGLLRHPAPIWEIVQFLRAELIGADWVIVCSRGAISTPLARTAAEVDGPALHQAREALDAAKRDGRVLAFVGFGGAVEALARYHAALYWSWTARQREVAILLRVLEPAAVAERLDVDRSAVSHVARRLRWRLVASADRSFRDLLEGR